MKKVLVTGSSSGIGEATARLFSENGYFVHLHGRNEQRLKKVASSLKGPSAIHTVDLEDLNSIETWVAEFLSHHSELHCLVNNAGLYTRKASLDMSINEVKQIFAVNFFSIFYLCQKLYPVLKASKGNIVNISSTVAARTILQTSAYSASKMALEGLTQHLALEWAPDIRVNAVAPGLVDTPIHAPGSLQGADNLQAMGRVGQADEIARSVEFLARDECSPWTTGAVLAVSGGGHLA